MAVRDNRPLTLREDRTLRSHPAVVAVTYTDDVIDVSFDENISYDDFPTPLEGLPVKYVDWDLQVVTFDAGEADD